MMALAPMTITYGDGKVINGEWEYAELEGDSEKAAEDQETIVLKYSDWKDRQYEYVITNIGISSYKDPQGNYLEFEYGGGDIGFYGPTEIKYNGETQANYDGTTTDGTRVGQEAFPNGHSVNYDYNYLNGEITKTYDDGKTAGYTFNSAGQVTSYTGIDDTTSNITYNEEGKITQITSYKCGVGIEEYTYDGNGNILTYTDKMDNVTTYEYNDPNNPDKYTKITGPAPFNYETAFTYDADEGWMLTRTDKMGRTIAYEYYDEGILKGLVKNITDWLNRETSYTYYEEEPKSRLLKTSTDHQNRTTEYDYDQNKNIKWIKDYLGRYTYLWYDNKGKLHKSTDVNGYSIDYLYDENENLFKIQDSEGKWTRKEYDDTNKLIRSYDSEGNILIYSYDDQGRIITATDSNGNNSRKEYDEYGRVIRTIDAKGYITSFEYDEWGNLTKIIDPILRERTFEYDPETLQLVKVIDPLGREIAYSCNEYCSVKTITGPNGWITKYYYNVKCNLVKVEFNDNSYYQFTYDELGRMIAATGNGNLYGENVYGGVFYGDRVYGSFKFEDKVYYGFDPSNTIYYEYYAADRLIKISYPDPGGTPIRKEITYHYDLQDRLFKVTDVSGMELLYTFDDDHDGRISSISKGGKTVSFVYDDEDEGKLLYILLPGNIKKEVITDKDTYRLTAIKYTKDDKTLYQFDYEYDEKANITEKTITLPSGKKNVYSYTYDSIDRLVSVKSITDTLSSNTWYDFDPNGNRTKKHKQSFPGGSDTVNYDYDACDELNCENNIRYSYDLFGNLTKEFLTPSESIEYSYNYSGKLQKIVFPDGSYSQFYYTHDGFRFKKKDKSGIVTNYYWDNQNNCLNESDENGIVNHWLFPGVGFKSLFNNNKWRFFITDHLGSIIALTDENGNITDEYIYDEYGSLTDRKGISYNNYGFIGQYRDEDSGLIPLWARYYNPRTGRFISRDPYGVNDGLNVYIYAKNNPITFRDTSGLLNEDDIWQRAKNYFTEPLVSKIRTWWQDRIGAIEQNIPMCHTQAITYKWLFKDLLDPDMGKFRDSHYSTMIECSSGRVTGHVAFAIARCPDLPTEERHIVLILDTWTQAGFPKNILYRNPINSVDDWKALSYHWCSGVSFSDYRQYNWSVLNKDDQNLITFLQDNTNLFPHKLR